MAFPDLISGPPSPSGGGGRDFTPLNWQAPNVPTQGIPGIGIGAGGGPRAPYWSSVIASEENAYSAGLTGSNLMKVQRMVAAGYTDAEIDQELSIGPSIASGGAGAGRAPSALEQTLAMLRQHFGPEAVQQYLQQHFLGQMSPAQQAQQARLQQSQEQSYALAREQFAWQQEQARIAEEARRRAEEAERKRMIEEWSSRPRDWATLWSATRGQGIGDYRPAIPEGVAMPNWMTQMGVTTGLTEAQGEPNPPWKQFLMSGQAGGMPPEMAFRLPGQGELGPMPSAQYLSSLNPSEREGLGGWYGRQGLDYGDILAAVQRRLPQRSAPMAQYGARRV